MTVEKNEKRSGATAEVLADSGELVRVAGYAAVFNQRANIADQFIEVIAPGAFRNAIARGDNVLFLINHGGLPLARTTSGTLKLSEDDHGLRMEAELDPLDPDVARLLPKIKRGDLSEMSFAFQIPQGGQDWQVSATGLSVRTINDVILHDVAVVNDGAYSGTSIDIAMRDLNRARHESLKAKNYNAAASRLRLKAGLDLKQRGQR